MLIKYHLISLELRPGVRRNQVLGLIIPRLKDTQKYNSSPTVEISRKLLLGQKPKNVRFRAGRLGFEILALLLALFVSWDGLYYLFLIFLSHIEKCYNEVDLNIK